MRDRAQRLLRELVERSFGEVERALLAARDGVLLAASNPSDIDDITAAFGAALLNAVEDAFTQFSAVKGVSAELEDGRVFVAKGLGGAVLCLLTRPRPNLGLINCLLERLPGVEVEEVEVGGG